jgi:hypothetical protein
MCYAFSFFCVGFIVPIVSQSLLKWAVNLPKEAVFITRKFWRLLLMYVPQAFLKCVSVKWIVDSAMDDIVDRIFMTGTVCCVTAAVVVLNITLYQLSRPDTSVDNTTMSKSPHVPVMISFIALGSAAIVTVLALSFYVLGNGVSASINRACFGRSNPNADATLNAYIEV